MLLVEAVPPEVCGFIARQLDFPVLSTGSGPEGDGQLLIVSDLIGQFQAFTPKFGKKYGNVTEVIANAMKSYCEDIRNGKFPRKNTAIV